VSDSSHERSKTYERQTADLFAVQSELVDGIARNLKAAGLAGAPRHVPNEEAHRLLLEGRYEVLRLTSESLARGKADYQHAIALDPGYALAYAVLGSAIYDEYIVRGGAARQTDGERKTAAELARKALELDPELSPPRTLLAALAMQYDWDWGRAERELRLALSNGSRPDPECWYALLLIFHARFPEADAHLQRAQELDPFGTMTLNNIALGRRFAGRFAEAREIYQKVDTLAPGALGPQMIGMTYVEEGRPDLALPEFRKLREQHPVAAILEAMA